jgi:hypothetical protein
MREWASKGCKNGGISKSDGVKESEIGVKSGQMDETVYTERVSVSVHS